eukprot:Em0011g82a
MEKQLGDLRRFGENFKLGSCCEDERPTKVSPELIRTTEELKYFHRTFNMKLDLHQAPNGGLYEQKRGPRATDQVTPNAPATPERHANGANGRQTRRRKRGPIEPATFGTLYELTGEVLGKGAQSSVFECCKKSSKTNYAVKVVHKSTEDIRVKVLREVEILYACKDRSNVLHLFEFFEDADKFYLVVSKMSGGALLRHIERRERFTEREASCVVKEVADALAFLHDHGIAHRDLKPDNILCKFEHQVTPVCICDFDLASMTPSAVHTPTTTPTPVLLTPVGSAEYMAPEVVGTFTGDAFSYDRKCDLWSLGVILYMMLCGKTPFHAHCGLSRCGWDAGESCTECLEILQTKIQEGLYEFPDKDWGGVSSDAKDLVSRLLVRNSRDRLSAHQVLEHHWVKDDVPNTPLATPCVLRSLTAHTHLSLYAASCMVLTRQISQQDQASLSPSSLRPDTTSAAKPASFSFNLAFQENLSIAVGDLHPSLTPVGTTGV